MPVQTQPAPRPAVARVWSPVVDQHATWIALNPLQGCPKSCAYCFLHERGQAAVRPATVADPVTAVQELLDSPFYGPRRPVALYTWTDVMALPSSREHLHAVLRLLVRQRVRNPIVLITKCTIPDETLELLSEARRQGLRLVVYLSYSGLGTEVEHGIRHDQLRATFPRVARAGVPIVHYWRPSIPASATPQTMATVLDWAARFARCTVAAGLKVEPAALPRLAAGWPELATTAGVTAAEGVYPRAFWDFIHARRTRHRDYPLFHTNSCALAYVLGEADRFGVLGTEVCEVRNHCPSSQRQRCAAAARRRAPLNEATVEAALARRGCAGATFTLDHWRREAAVDAALPTNTVAALTQDLGVRVRAERPGDDPYWNSGTAGALPLVLGDAE